MSRDIDQRPLMTDDNDLTGDEEFAHSKELDFPWSLINVANKIFAIDQSDPHIVKQWFFSFRLHLFIIFVICLLCIIFGATNLEGYCYTKMLPVCLIVQGTCGLFVVMVYVCAIVFGYVKIT